MTTKEGLHRLIDELPEAVLPVVERYLESVRDDPVLHALATAPEEDEELSPEEAAALAEARARRAAGDNRYTPSEELRREIGW
jgi:hypothetical protein